MSSGSRRSMSIAGDPMESIKERDEYEENSAHSQSATKKSRGIRKIDTNEQNENSEMEIIDRVNN